MNTRSKAPALDKGLKILEYLSQVSEAQSLTQIAQGIEYKVSEIQRMVEQLIDSGYLIRDNLGGYYLSSKLFLIVNKNPPHKHLLNYAIGPMEYFAQKTGETIHIGILIGSHIRFIGQVEGTGHCIISTKMGIFPAHKTTSGKVLLAFHEELNIDLIDMADSERRSLRRELNKIKKQGYLYSKSAYTEGVYDLSVPIQLEGYGVLAALTTYFVLTKNHRPLKDMIKDYLEALQECASQITAKYTHRLEK